MKIFPFSKGKLQRLDCYFPFAGDAGVYQRWSLEALKVAKELCGKGFAGRRQQLFHIRTSHHFRSAEQLEGPQERAMDADVGRRSVISAPALIALAAAVAAAV